MPTAHGVLSKVQPVRLKMEVWGPRIRGLQLVLGVKTLAAFPPSRNAPRYRESLRVWLLSPFTPDSHALLFQSSPSDTKKSEAFGP